MQTAPEKLENQIEALFDAKPARYTEEDQHLFRAFKEELNSGRMRAAEPDSSQRRLADQRMGEKGNPPGLSHGAVVDMSVDSAKQPFSIRTLTR